MTVARLSRGGLSGGVGEFLPGLTEMPAGVTSGVRRHGLRFSGPGGEPLSEPGNILLAKPEQGDAYSGI